MNIRNFARELQNIFDEMSAEFSNFQNNSGLHCLEGCGRCCNNPEVEASALEMIPLALRLIEEGKYDEWMQKLEHPERDICPMYQAHSPDLTKGMCGIYHERPSLCRMFGVSGYFNKHHAVTLSVCKLIREKYPELADQREREINPETTPMLMAWSHRLAELDPALIQHKLPMNEAIKQALQKVALYTMYEDPT